MQYYVKSAGRGYDQDYTWVQFAGEPGDRTDVLRRMSRFLSMKTLSLALFWQDSEFYLLAGGLKSGRTDIVGTPITDTFAFICPAEEEEKIRFLTAGIAGTHPALMQLLCSATCEDVQMSSGFRVSEDFVNALQVWPANGGISISALLEKEPEPFAGKLMHLLQNCLPEHIQNILLINSDSESRQDFYVFCSKKMTLTSAVPWGKIQK